MTTKETWHHTNGQRAQIYLWFGALFSLEQTKEQLEHYQSDQLQGLYDLFIQLGLTKEVGRFKSAIQQVLKDDHSEVELAADFAQHFLLDEKISALPYASYYLENGRLYGDIESKMCEFLKDNALTVASHFKEPADHLAIYLYLMAHWIERANNYDKRSEIFHDQAMFLKNGLLSWLPNFVEKSQMQRLKYDLYPAISQLLLAFIMVDIELLSQD